MMKSAVGAIYMDEPLASAPVIELQVEMEAKMTYANEIFNIPLTVANRPILKS